MTRSFHSIKYEFLFFFLLCLSFSFTFSLSVSVLSLLFLSPPRLCSVSDLHSLPLISTSCPPASLQASSRAQAGLTTGAGLGGRVAVLASHRRPKNVWSQEGQWEPAAGRMEPLSGQEKLSTSSARLNGNTGGQEWGEAPTGVDMGDPQGSPALLVSVGVSGRAQTSEVTVSSPGLACPGEQDQGGQRPVRWLLCISPWVAWALPSPHPPQSFRGSHKGDRNRGGVALA